MNNIILIILGIYLIYCQENMLFYKTEQKHCKKWQGDCENCDCWSCKRKEYIGFFD